MWGANVYRDYRAVTGAPAQIVFVFLFSFSDGSGVPEAALESRSLRRQFESEESYRAFRNRGRRSV